MKVCAKCKVVLRCKENDVGAIECADFGPYQLWSADLWECPTCGAAVLVGFGARPIAQHFQADFQRLCESYPTTVAFWHSAVHVKRSA